MLAPSLHDQQTSMLKIQSAGGPTTPGAARETFFQHRDLPKRSTVEGLARARRQRASPWSPGHFGRRSQALN